MGYRSDVTLGVDKKAFEKHKTKDLIVALQHCDIIRDNGEDVYFQWQDVKWYPSYNEVVAVMEFLNKLKDDHYGMVIVGEEQGDIENFGCPWDFEIYAVTTIEEPNGNIVDNNVFLAQKSNVTDILVGK